MFGVFVVFVVFVVSYFELLDSFWLLESYPVFLIRENMLWESFLEDPAVTALQILEHQKPDI